MREQGLPPKARLKKSWEFKGAGEAAHKEVGRFFVVLGSRYEGLWPRLGLAVGKKAGNAVQRNQVKRIGREAFRHMQHRLPSRDFVVIGRAGSGKRSSPELRRDIEKLLHRFQE